VQAEPSPQLSLPKNPVLRRSLNLGSLMKKPLIALAAALDLQAGAAFSQNASELYQSGTSNSATIDQALAGAPGSLLGGSPISGLSNTFQVYQGLNTAGSSNNTVDIGQLGGNGSILSATVQQDGSGQYAYVRQDGTSGGAIRLTITQSNQNNYSNVTQTSGGPGANIGYTITQSGVNGVVVVNQRGSAGSYSITQTGMNESYYDGGTGISSLSEGGSPQGGIQASSGAFVPYGIALTQTGDSNNQAPVFVQYSDYSAASVTQTGDLGGTNISSVSQNSGAYNVATVWQTAASGVTNTSVLTQSGAGSNFASVNQH
jgi:hypothetical protein